MLSAKMQNILANFPPVETRPATAWTKYHYAMLTCRGVSSLFDTLRYENAFLCRKKDVAAIKQALSGLEVANTPVQVLICKYDEGRHGSWTLGRLMSDMRLEELPVAAVFALDSDFTSVKPTSRLKHCNEVQVTTTADKVLDMLFLNHAMPADEASAHIIEQVPYAPEKEITVRLRTFSAVPGAWQFVEGVK